MYKSANALITNNRGDGCTPVHAVLRGSESILRSRPDTVHGTSSELRYGPVCGTNFGESLKFPRESIAKNPDYLIIISNAEQ